MGGREVAKMSKYIYPEDGIKAVSFETKDELLTWSTVVTNIQVNVPATERIKLSCDNLMQEAGSKLLKLSPDLKEQRYRALELVRLYDFVPMLEPPVAKV